MPEWVSKATCSTCKKRGHLSFKFLPKYACKVIKDAKSKFRNKMRSSNIPKNTTKEQLENLDHVTEFAGMAYIKNEGEYTAHLHQTSTVWRYPKPHHRYNCDNNRCKNDKMNNPNREHHWKHSTKFLFNHNRKFLNSPKTLHLISQNKDPIIYYKREMDYKVFTKPYSQNF